MIGTKSRAGNQTNKFSEFGGLDVFNFIIIFRSFIMKELNQFELEQISGGVEGWGVAAGAIAGAIGGAKYGASAGWLGGPWGAVAGGVGGALLGGIAGAAATN